MQESFLSYIWTYQKFDKSQLTTTQNLPISIFKQGYLNNDAGQDFSEARIKIDGIEWVGNVELHIKSSDWDKHKHQNDKAYNNTILHVVWENDLAVYTEDGRLIPVLELKKIVPPSLLEKYQLLTQNLKNIACEDFIMEVPDLIKNNQSERSLINRLERKAEEILALYSKSNNNWQETTYQLLAKNFGFKVNATAFHRLSEKLPIKILQKHSNNLLQVEALLFGTAGFLTELPDDNYTNQLEKEFNFLKHKYQLEETGLLNIVEWKFLRLRPNNFPTLRLAQFASFISNNSNPFSVFILASDTKLIKEAFKITPSSFWQNHYHFNKESSQVGKFGESSVDSILINTVAPLLTAYSIQKDDYSYREKALLLLESIKPEKNKITKVMTSLNFENENAGQSQGLIELHNEFCQNKECLRCSIGTSIVK